MGNPVSYSRTSFGTWPRKPKQHTTCYCPPLAARKETPSWRLFLLFYNTLLGRTLLLWCAKLWLLPVSRYIFSTWNEFSPVSRLLFLRTLYIFNRSEKSVSIYVWYVLPSFNPQNRLVPIQKDVCHLTCAAYRQGRKHLYQIWLSKRCCPQGQYGVYLDVTALSIWFEDRLWSYERISICKEPGIH